MTTVTEQEARYAFVKKGHFHKSINISVFDEPFDGIKVDTSSYRLVFDFKVSTLQISRVIYFENLDHKNTVVISFSKWKDIVKYGRIHIADIEFTLLYILDRLKLSINDFIDYYWPSIKHIFEIYERNTGHILASINLVPLNKDIKIDNLRTQDWYQKFLTEYIEYRKSEEKTDIADNYYQEQARLHGLKFSIK